jgi:hypothetical protein
MEYNDPRGRLGIRAPGPLALRRRRRPNPSRTCRVPGDAKSAMPVHVMPDHHLCELRRVAGA